MKKIHLFPALLILFVFAGCVKDPGNNTQTTENPDALAPDGFVFSTTKPVSVDVQLLTNDNKPLAGILVNVYAKQDIENALYTGLTDARGRVQTTLSLAAYVDSLVVDPAYVGLLRNATAVVRNNAVQAIIGGTAGYGGDVVLTEGRTAGGLNFSKTAGTTGSTVVSYLGSYDNNGRPTSLAPSAVITPELLSFVNESLPEGKAVKKHHPSYLSANAETKLHIKKLSDVWISFVHEGTANKNTLGFYSYPINQKPHNATDIDTIKLAVPNASLTGSGGGMRSGDKVYLGRFPGGTMVDLVLLQNAWNSTTRTVNAGANKFYAEDNFNDEKSNSKRHAVLLHDTKNKLFLYGFEDAQRDNGASDEDFNDLVFYATTNPVDGINETAVNTIAQPTDSDGDGITDTNDEFPTDAARAYTSYFPARTTWGTLAFEDNWPYTGDYDLNDLVVNYQYKYVMNSAGKTVELFADYAVRGFGATQKNAFGVQFPFASTRVSSVSGQRLTSGIISTSANGTEARQSYAVVVPFDDAKTLFTTQTNFVNVYNNLASQVSDTAHLKITFTSPLTAAELGTAPYNPFLIPGQVRAREVHLPGNKPTDKADAKLLGTGKDNSNLAKNKYYLTQNNWPWALSFVEKFDHPTEGSQISKAYINFLAWAKNGGSANADWHTKKTGNRNEGFIYSK